MFSMGVANKNLVFHILTAGESLVYFFQRQFRVGAINSDNSSNYSSMNSLVNYCLESRASCGR